MTSRLVLRGESRIDLWSGRRTFLLVFGAMVVLYIATMARFDFERYRDIDLVGFRQRTMATRARPVLPRDRDAGARRPYRLEMLVVVAPLLVMSSRLWFDRAAPLMRRLFWLALAVSVARQVYSIAIGFENPWLLWLLLALLADSEYPQNW